MSVREKYNVAIQDPVLKFIACINVGVGTCIIKSGFDWSTRLEVTRRQL